MSHFGGKILEKLQIGRNWPFRVNVALFIRTRKQWQAAVTILEKDITIFSFTANSYLASGP